MSIVNRLKQYLDENKIKYTWMVHSKAYTAQEVAQTMHVPGKELAKTIVVKADEEFMMAVLPAPYHVDLTRLKKAIGARHLELASEAEFTSLFPECEIGAMPPFGNLYLLPVYVSEQLTKDKEIVFNAGTHTDAIRMKYDNFAELVRPKVADFAKRIEHRAA
jgi:Ala-tRNA(Pro) deacylase